MSERMNREQFQRKWLDTHEELSAIEQLSSGNSNLVKSSDGDKNITATKAIPGKSIIEKQNLSKRADNLRDFLLDVVEVRSVEILEDMPIDKVLHYALKAAVPQMVHTKNEHTFSFADMAKRAYDNEEDIIDIEAS